MNPFISPTQLGGSAMNRFVSRLRQRTRETNLFTFTDPNQMQLIIPPS
jgi:hypothetical protein